METVRSPAPSGTDRPPPSTPPAPAAQRLRAQAWWSALADGPAQFLSAGAPNAPAEFCRRLAATGYPDARWAASEVFRGEWECSSTLAGTGEKNHAFVLVRGGSRDRADRLMVKLTATEPANRVVLADKAWDAIRAFADMNGLLLSQEAFDRLHGWQPGRTWTSQGPFTAIAEAGRADVRAINLSATAALPRPNAKDCGAACRDELASLTQAVEARPVRSIRRTTIADRPDPPPAAAGRVENAEPEP